jgi:hypothetical protein
VVACCVCATPAAALRVAADRIAVLDPRSGWIQGEPRAARLADFAIDPTARIAPARRPPSSWCGCATRSAIGLR